MSEHANHCLQILPTVAADDAMMQSFMVLAAAPPASGKSKSFCWAATPGQYFAAHNAITTYVLRAAMAVRPGRTCLAGGMPQDH